MKRILTGVHFKIRVSDFRDIISIDPRMTFYDFSFEYKGQLWPRRIDAKKLFISVFYPKSANLDMKWLLNGKNLIYSPLILFTYDLKWPLSTQLYSKQLQIIRSSSSQAKGIHEVIFLGHLPLSAQLFSAIKSHFSHPSVRSSSIRP